jgi:hypothetical protein
VHVRVTRTIPTTATLAVLTLALGCDAADRLAGAPSPEVVLDRHVEQPTLPPPGEFVAVVTNPWYPLIPGTVFEYRAETDEGIETTIAEVTSEEKSVLGIDATVVRDRVYLDGELVEDTRDWFAQDRWGNVWYLGEESCEYEEGECVSTEGSWEAGVDGAEAGIVMWADPAAHRGRAYRQEYYEGEAEDLGKVLRLDARVSVPYGDFFGCLETMDWTPLEPGHREHKFYCAETGLVLEVSPRDGRQRNELVRVTRP